MDTYIADLSPFKFKPKTRNLRKILGCSTTTDTYNPDRERHVYSGCDDVLALLQRRLCNCCLPRMIKAFRTAPRMAAQGMISTRNLSDGRRLTELGCRTIELFVASHIFRKMNPQSRRVRVDDLGICIRIWQQYASELDELKGERGPSPKTQF